MTELTSIETKILRKLTAIKGTQRWIGMADVRREIIMTPATLDAHLRNLSAKGLIDIAPEHNRKALTPEAQANAIRLGGEDNHLLMVL